MLFNNLYITTQSRFQKSQKSNYIIKKREGGNMIEKVDTNSLLFDYETTPPKYQAHIANTNATAVQYDTSLSLLK